MQSIPKNKKIHTAGAPSTAGMSTDRGAVIRKPRSAWLEGMPSALGFGFGLLCHHTANNLITSGAHTNFFCAASQQEITDLGRREQLETKA